MASPPPAVGSVAALAQSSGATSQIIVWAAIIIGVILVGGVVIFVVRGYALRSQDDTGAGVAGFTLHELRELHGSGQLSDEEFEAARTQLIGRLRGDDGPDEVTEAEVEGATAEDDRENEQDPPPSGA